MIWWAYRRTFLWTGWNWNQSLAVPPGRCEQNEDNFRERGKKPSTYSIPKAGAHSLKRGGWTKTFVWRYPESDTFAEASFAVTEPLRPKSSLSTAVKATSCKGQRRNLEILYFSENLLKSIWFWNSDVSTPGRKFDHAQVSKIHSHTIPFYHMIYKEIHTCKNTSRIDKVWLWIQAALKGIMRGGAYHVEFRRVEV